MLSLTWSRFSCGMRCCYQIPPETTDISLCHWGDKWHKSSPKADIQKSPEIQQGDGYKLDPELSKVLHILFLNFLNSLLFHLFTHKNISRLFNGNYGLEYHCKSVGQHHWVWFSPGSLQGSVLAVLGAVDGWLHAQVGKAVEGGGSLPACSPVSMESTSIISDSRHSYNYSNNRLYISTHAS